MDKIGVKKQIENIPEFFRLLSYWHDIYWQSIVSGFKKTW
jgi:hypothetical protein